MTTAHDVIANINATFKEEVLKTASDPSFVVTYLPTGVLPVDVLFGGGLPRGRFTTITGDYSTLKSYIGLRAIATTQASGGIAAIIDTEHAFDPEWAESLGVDLKTLIIKQPVSGELAIDIAEGLILSGVDLIVFDSVAAALPEAEREKRLHGEKVQPARIAQLMSVAMRKLTAANSRTAVLWINQLRMNIGVTFGNPEVATGGKALPYYSSYILSVRKAGKIVRAKKQWDGEKMVDGKEQVGQKFKAELLKSKLSKPFGDAYFTWSMEDSAIDETGYLIGACLEAGLVTQKGASWAYGTHKAQGREKFKALVDADPALQDTMKTAVWPTLFPAPVTPRAVRRKRAKARNAD